MDRDILQNDHRTAEFAGYLAVLIMAGLYSISRIGMPGHGQVLLVTGVAYFLLGLPPLLRQILGLKRSWLASRELILFLLCLLVASVGMHVGTLKPLGVFLSIAGYLVVLFRLLSARGVVPLRWPVLFPVVALSLWMAATSWNGNYGSPLLMEKVQLGIDSRDMYSYGAIGNMLQTHGVSSVGLDGVVPFPYNYGGVWLCAGFASLLGMSSLDFFQLGYPVVFTPILLYVLLLLIGRVRNVVFSSGRLRSFQDDSYPLIICCLCLFCPIYGGLPAVNLFKSFSYGFSVILGCLLGGMFLQCISDKEQRLVPLFYLVVAPALALMLGVVKIHALYFYLCCLAPFALLRKTHLHFKVGFWGASLLAPVIVFMFSSPGARIAGLTLLADPRRVGFVKYFFEMYWLSWGYLAVRFWQGRIKGIRKGWEDWKDGKLDDVVLLCAGCILGALPGMLLSIRGGDYFVYYQFIVATVLICSGSHALFGSIRLPRLWLRLVAVGGCCLVVMGVAVPLEQAVMHNVAVRKALRCYVDTGKTPGRSLPATWAGISEYGETIKGFAGIGGFTQEELGSTPNGRMVAMLQSFREKVDMERAKALLYIPKTASTFWQLVSANHIAPLVGPALSGHAMVNGIPLAGEAIVDLSYGLASYDLNDPARGADMPVSDLCVKVRLLGFSKVLVVSEDGGAYHEAMCP